MYRTFLLKDTNVNRGKRFNKNQGNHSLPKNHLMKVRQHKMKATGIVRRIDDLGRVVIPKEIRRTLRIREGDPLEIFVDRDGEVILKKYSPISELSDFAKEYAEALYDSLGSQILICDRDAVISVAGVSKKDYLNKNIGSPVEKVMDDRTTQIVTQKGQVSLIDGFEEELSSYTISPIVANGDPIGAVIIFSKDRTLGEVEQKAAETASAFLARQMEQ
jgi:AbrB family transcriptional regulator (stage V sporulation protein T)